MLSVDCVLFFNSVHQADRAAPAVGEHDGVAVDVDEGDAAAGTAGVVPDAQDPPSRGPKWNKVKKVTDQCSKWATSMLDVHKETGKVTIELQKLEAQKKALTPSQLEPLSASQSFLNTLEQIFSSWLGTAEKAEATKAEATFDVILKGAGGHATMKAAWLEAAPEVENFPSWAVLQKFASTELAVANTKAALDESVASGLKMKKAVVAFLKSVQKTAAELGKKVDKLKAATESEQMVAIHDEGVLQEAALCEANIIASAPETVSVPPKGPTVLALFNEDTVEIAAVPVFTIKDHQEFTPEWMRSQLQGASLAFMQCPYAVSAAPWLTHINTMAEVTASFGRFMADFLGSDEYNSAIGKATQGLQGMETVAGQLRAMVIADEKHNALLQLSQADINKQVSNVKQQGRQSVRKPVNAVSKYMSE